MYQIKKRFIIVTGIAVVVMVTSVFIFALQGKRRQLVQISAEGGSYRTHLETFLEDSGLTSVRKEKEGFTYYELRDTDGDLQGFIFLGEEEGYGGLIRLFVWTDIKGIIQRIDVWQHNETPIVVPPDELRRFLDTFVPKRAEAKLEWQQDVHGITGATITAEAIIKAVYEQGLAAYERGIFSPVRDNAQ